ncbi:MAG: acyl carrier protein [Devosia sp.]|nr:acyl carrier protein [Devosia sp.]
MNTQQAETALAEELRRIAPDVDVADIDRDGDLREEFDIDSMDFLNLVTALNKRLGIPIPEPDYSRFDTFAGAVAYLIEKTP